jgi:2-methylcitrate dehydratase PrpD
MVTIEAPLAAALEWLFRTRAPAAVQSKAREVMLDTFGCVLAARRHPEVAAFGEALEAADPGSASSAAAGFAAAACWDEACEGLARAHGRPGLSVLGALHALARNKPHTLDEVLAAYVIGYEVGARLGETMRVGPGMHVDGAWPSLGVAAAVVRLLGGNAAQALDAIRIAACQMPYSLYLPVAVGANARNTYLSHSAQLGMLAASAALGGIAAPEGALEELRSRALAGAPPGPRLAPPGEWLILETYLKPYAAVRHVHYGAAAAQALRADIGDRLREVQGIQLSTYGEALAYCGNRAPKTAIQAQFSLSYGVACMLATGELSPASYSADTLAREDIRVLEALVEISEREDLTITGQRGATLSIELRNEIRMQAVENVPGDPGTPMARLDILLKFARYSGLNAARGAQFLDAAGERRFADISPL